MFDHILKMYLKVSKKQYLLPFLEGLINLGQPSTVMFPVELLEQGLGLVLSGLNNTLATQTNLDWIWPYWLERQQDPGDPSFIPTGVNLLCANLTRRNWTSLGAIHSAQESMLDPVGMLTPRPFGWSCFPFIRYDGELKLPPRMKDHVVQTLDECYLPNVHTEYILNKPLLWTSEAQAIQAAGEEMISFSHHLENRGSATLSFSFGLSLRPYNPLTLGHINRLKYKNRLWRVNGRPGILLLSDPDRVTVSDRHLGDPLLIEPGRLQVPSGASRSGILAGVCEFDITLEPGQSRTIESLIPLASSKDRPRLKFRGIHPESVAQAKEQARDLWRDNARRGTLIRVPDAELTLAFQAVKNHLHVFDDIGHFSPGTFFYHGHWFRDGAFLALGFENAGFADLVGPKLPGFLKRQTYDGFFRSQNGEWDSNGQAIWTMTNHVRRTGNLALLKELFPSMRKGCTWIENQCRKTLHAQTPHAGLLPPGISAEHFGPNDHYFWDNFWGLAGLKQTLWAARRLGKEGEASKLAKFVMEYRRHLGRAINGSLARTGGQVLPTSPYRNPDSAAIGNIVAISPLDLHGIEDPWVQPTLDFLVENNLRHGLFFQKIIHTGMNAYLSAQLARGLLAMGDPRWYGILGAIRRYGGGTLTWPEAIHPRTGGGCMGDGDHGWAAAEFVSLIRDMMVREQSKELHLGAGWIPAWWEPGQELELVQATTHAGTLSYLCQIAEHELTLTWELVANPLSEPLTLVLILPPHISASGTKPGLMGQSKLTLPAPCGSLTVGIHRSAVGPIVHPELTLGDLA